MIAQDIRVPADRTCWEFKAAQVPNRLVEYAEVEGAAIEVPVPEQPDEGVGNRKPDGDHGNGLFLESSYAPVAMPFQVHAHYLLFAFLALAVERIEPLPCANMCEQSRSKRSLLLPVFSQVPRPIVDQPSTVALTRPGGPFVRPPLCPSSMSCAAPIGVCSSDVPPT